MSRIALIDAPSVLGWAQWREIGLRYGFGLIQGTLEAAMEAGQIERRPVRPLAHLLLGRSTRLRCWWLGMARYAARSATRSRGTSMGCGDVSAETSAWCRPGTSTAAG